MPARCTGVEVDVAGSAKRCLNPKDTFQDCFTDLKGERVCGPEMVVVPAGKFTMGSSETEEGREKVEGPQHKVTIGKEFAVGRFAVTFEEWDACMADGGCNGYKPTDGEWGRGKHPAVYVNWDDAKAYASWLSRKSGKTYRLPSEAEREYVTRAGTTTPFWWGSPITLKQANYGGSYYGDSQGEQRTVPVDSFEPNPWGLYQVHGNVWEWTEDCFNGSYVGNPGDGRARTTGNCTGRVVRGGSWIEYARHLRSASRKGYYTDARSLDKGFRLARTLRP
jgi:formylglycine-generating enzyme required for sulfatase activity